jgi:4'-phosphopantetheinyl transferase
MTLRHGDHRPSLSTGEIHVWAARLCDDHRAAAAFLRILSREERARAERLAFQRDRIRFIQAHGIVRQILAEYCDVDTASLTFARNRHGKPCLVWRANDHRLQFSISHSGNCCMLALRLDHALGIDVEKVRDLPRTMDIVQSYFTSAESKALAALRGTARQDAFFALWTHKEAMVKGLGVSLAANLGRVAFDVDPVAGPRLAAWAGDRSVASRWFIRRLDPAPGYVAALASRYPIRSLALQNWTLPPCHAGARPSIGPPMRLPAVDIYQQLCNVFTR